MRVLYSESTSGVHGIHKEGHPMAHNYGFHKWRPSHVLLSPFLADFIWLRGPWLNDSLNMPLECTGPLAVRAESSESESLVRAEWESSESLVRAESSESPVRAGSI